MTTPRTPEQAWARFLAENGPDWVAEWTPATGTPRAVYGAGLKVKDGAVTTLDEARRLAAATLDRYAELLGRGASTFVETTGMKASRVWIFVYGQQFRGLEVIGGRADVRLHDSGGVSMLGSQAFPIPADFSVVARIDLATARARAWASKELEPPKAPAAAADRLVIWGDVEAKARSPVHLAWEIAVDQIDRKIVGKSYVDAVNGAVLGWRNDYHECGFGCSEAHAELAEAANELRVETYEAEPVAAPPLAPVLGKVMAWTNIGLRPTDALQNVPVRNVLVRVVGGSTGYTDANGDFNIPHTGNDPVQVSVEFKGRRVADTIPRQGTKLVAQVQATPGTPVTIQIYTSSADELSSSQATGYWGADDINEYLRAIIGGPLPTRIDLITVYTSLAQTCNAHYTGNTINFYARGGSCNMTCYSTVIYHEWGHGIDDAYGGISQTDGLSEGWGDMMAIYRSGQPIVADNFFTNGNYIRTALNTYTYPAGGGVHQQGQTWMGFGWDVRENLRASLGNANGTTLAEKIVLTSIGANATNQPSAVREVFILDDNDSNLNNGTPHYVELEKAAVKRKLPYPAKRSDNPGVYTTFGVGCPGSGNMPTTCIRRNDTATNTNTSTLVNLTYAIEVTAPVDLTIDGFELNTSSRTGSTVYREARLYSADTTGRPGTIERKTQMAIGPTVGWYKVTFSPPWSVPANSQFFLSWVNQATGITGSITSGTPSPYYRNDGVSGAWTGPYNTLNWAYRVSCVATGGAVPILGSTGFPEINSSFDVTLQAAAANAPFVLFLGTSKTAWGVIPLPLDLTPLGAASCWLLASGELQGAFLATAAGTGNVTLPLPNDTNLVNALFYNQILVVDAAANKLGIAFTNGGQAKIGKGP